MKFELDNALLSDLLFHMENQDGIFLLDTEKGIVVDGQKPDHRFIALPNWTPSDGFRLMEMFVSTCKNPIARQELSDALNQSKGVFRAFKNVIEQYPEISKQWFYFKEQKMKAEVIVWYNGLREEWGLEPIGEEPEDNSSLIMEDFVFKQKDCSDCEMCFTAESADGETAGCICAVKDESGLYINKLEVNEKYKGMGLGKTLLSKFLEKTEGKTVTIELPVKSEFFARSLRLEGFRAVSYKFKRDHE